MPRDEGAPGGVTQTPRPSSCVTLGLGWGQQGLNRTIWTKQREAQGAGRDRAPSLLWWQVSQGSALSGCFGPGSSQRAEHPQGPYPRL